MRIVFGWVCLLGLLTGSVAAHADEGVLTTREVLEAAREQAVAVARETLNATDAVLRANGVEALSPVAELRQPALSLALADPSEAVRFAGLMLVAKHEVAALGDEAVRLQTDEDPSVRGAAVYASYVLDRPADMAYLARLAGTSDPWVRGNAYLILGEMSLPGTVTMLREMSQLPMSRATVTERSIADLQLAEAMVKLGEEELGLGVVRAAMYEKTNEEVRVFAVAIAGRLSDRAYAPALRSMVQQPTEEDPPELAILAATGLARMGDASGLEVLVEASRRETLVWQEQEYDAFTHRAQSAFGLGEINDVRAATALVRLLQDENPYVRVSAAAAVLKALEQ